ncbi:MAG: type IV pilus assembly protein PilM [Desulfobacterales bacterium]
MFGKKTHLIGLDIGSKTFKVASVEETKKGHNLKEFGMTDIPSGVIEEGSIKDPEQAADSIRQLFTMFNIKERNVALSIGGYSVIVKKINVEAMSEDELQETINIEAEQYIPFDISDVNIDFQILGENENNPNQIDVLLVAAKKEIINDYVNLTQMAGLNPCIIDIDAFSLQNIYELNYETKDENIALIDIGASKTSLNILKGNSSVFIRDVSLGCGQINERIVSLVDCTLDEAEELKYGDQTDKISEENLTQIISAVSADWCMEIGRAFDFFYSTYPDQNIKRIVLSGGGGNIKEFQQLLASEISIEVTTIYPFKNFSIDSKFDSSYLEKIAPQAAICMGLSTRRIDDK